MDRAASRASGWGGPRPGSGRRAVLRRRDGRQDDVVFAGGKIVRALRPPGEPTMNAVAETAKESERQQERPR